MALPITTAVGVNLVSGLLQAVNKKDVAKGQSNYYRQQADGYRKNARQIRLKGAREEDQQRALNRKELANYSATAEEAGLGESPTYMSDLVSKAAYMEQNLRDNRAQTENDARQALYQAKVAENKARAIRKNSRNVFTSNLIKGISSALRML